MRSILLLVGLCALVTAAAGHVLTSAHDASTARRHAADQDRTSRIALDEELLTLRARVVELDERANRLEARDHAFLDRLDVVTAALLNPEAALLRHPVLAQARTLR